MKLKMMQADGSLTQTDDIHSVRLHPRSQSFPYPIFFFP